MNRAVFLDRDGVINQGIVREGRPYAPTHLRDSKLLPKVSDAITCFRENFFKVIVITNQPDVRSGKVTLETVEAMHDRLRNSLPIDDIRVCYHIDEDGCECRKPKPGMLIDAACIWDIDLNNSFMVGDRWRDVEAGNAAGCQTIFIDAGYQEKQPDNPNYIVSNLIEAVPLILTSN